MSPSHDRKERDPSRYTRTPTVLTPALLRAYSPGAPYLREDIITWFGRDWGEEIAGGRASGRTAARKDFPELPQRWQRPLGRATTVVADPERARKHGRDASLASLSRRGKEIYDPRDGQHFPGVNPPFVNSSHGSSRNPLPFPPTDDANPERNANSPPHTRQECPFAKFK